MMKSQINQAPEQDHDSVVADWRQNAEKNDNENYTFLRNLKVREYGFEPDELAAELHKQAFEIVDCTRCANCCKTMDVGLSSARHRSDCQTSRHDSSGVCRRVCEPGT